MSPSSVVPWKPATTATRPASRAAWMRSAVMRWMRARVWAASVTMPDLRPGERAGGMAERLERHREEADRDLLAGGEDHVHLARVRRGGDRGGEGDEARRWSCPSPRPRRPRGGRRRADSATRRATFVIFSASATDEPPYFCTISRPMRAPSYTTPARSVKPRPPSARAAAGAAAVVARRPDLARRRLAALPHLLAGLLALLGRHGAPPLEVPVQSLALLRRERLVALVALLELLPPVRRGAAGSARRRARARACDRREAGSSAGSLA